MSELTETALNSMYNQLQQEQQRLMSDLKGTSISKAREKELYKRISFLQGILVSLLKYKSIQIQE